LFVLIVFVIFQNWNHQVALTGGMSVDSSKLEKSQQMDRKPTTTSNKRPRGGQLPVNKREMFLFYFIHMKMEKQTNYERVMHIHNIQQTGFIAIQFIYFNK
jgi:hypothetical protein